MKMTVFKYFVRPVTLFFVFSSVVIASDEVPEKIQQAIRSSVGEIIPGGSTGEVVTTPIPGLYKVSIGAGRSLLMTEDGQYIISGELYRKTGDGLVNLSENERKGYRKELLDHVKTSDMIIFPAKGDRKAIINVFTDVDCGYCRKLHKGVPELNEHGVEIRYLAFPRAGIGSKSYAKIATAWCAANPQQALTDLKSGKEMELNVCDGNPVAEQYRLGNEMGVQGTPALVLMDGTMIPGYRPVDDLLEMLGL